MKLKISKHIYIAAGLVTLAYLLFLIFSYDMSTYNWKYCPPGTIDYCSWNLKHVLLVVVPSMGFVFALSLTVLVILKKIYEYLFK